MQIYFLISNVKGESQPQTVVKEVVIEKIVEVPVEVKEIPMTEGGAVEVIELEWESQEITKVQENDLEKISEEVLTSDTATQPTSTLENIEELLRVALYLLGTVALILLIRFLYRK